MHITVQRTRTVGYCLKTVYGKIMIKQQLANIFYKRPESTYFKFGGPYSLCYSYLSPLLFMKAAVGKIQMNKHAMFPSTLFVKEDNGADLAQRCSLLTIALEQLLKGILGV